MRRNNDFRVYVRNKSRYNPETKERGFLYVDVHDFAGTTIGQIKEDVRRQCRGSIRIDELFLNNNSLADDRSVAHYNLDNGCILETTSNPLWVSCLYIKASEIKQEQEGNPTDEVIQKWTQKSLPKKYTLIGLLLNSKKEYEKQPQHFATMDEFAIYLERLNKKGATMHPDYTQKDMRAFEREYRQEFLGRYDDPIAAFIDHHAVRLGHVLPDEIDQPARNDPHIGARPVVQRPNNSPIKNKKKRNQRYCEDCEEAIAEVYCTECQGGLAMCRGCSAVLHAGASRRRHNLQDMDQAPAPNAKPYVPRAFQAPFAIILSMYSALNERQMLSLTEDEIKKRAQLLTDTDLQDKQAGKYVGGFDCMENNLMNKGLVKKEAARIPTYALSASGQALGEKLYTFYTQFYMFMESCRLPKVQNRPRTRVVNNRKLCLLIDENERDKERLLRYAEEKNIDAQVRMLPAGDYVWILTPPMVDTHVRYTGKDSDNEMVLPFVVERKSWEDFENSTNSARFQRQVNNMLGCGLANCFYLMEGSMSGLRNTPTHNQQHYLKQQLEKLITESGFYVNYTSSWMKSAQWLLWFTGFLMDGLSSGVFLNQSIAYRDYMSRVARQRGSANNNATFRNATRHTHTWRANLFIDHIIRDSMREQDMMSTIQDTGVNVGDRYHKHLLVIQDLEQYNKKRQSCLNKCCDAVFHNPGGARDIVEDKLGPVVHNMIHYDVASYWQLYIQILTGVYVVRTENVQDTEKMQRLFSSAIPAQVPLGINNHGSPGKKDKAVRPRNAGARKKTATATIGHMEGNDLGYAAATNNPMPRKQNISGSAVNSDNKTDYSTPGGRKKPNIQSIFSLDRSSSGPSHVDDDAGDNGDTDSLGVPGSVIKNQRNLLNTAVDHLHVKQTGIKQSDVKPFSGEGYCLGSVNNDDNSIDRAEVNRTVGAYNNLRNTRPVIPGLVGGTLDIKYPTSVDRPTAERGVGRDDTLNDSVLNAADFTDSQNEEDIMLKVLAESAAEVKSRSNEDEMYKLAVEMSVQSSSNINTDKFTEEEQVQLAIQMSQTPECSRTTRDVTGVGQSLRTDKKLIYKKEQNVALTNEEEELQRVLELSKLDTKADLGKAMLHARTDESVVTSVIDEEQMFNIASQMSLKDFQKVRNRQRVDADDDDEDDVIVIDDESEAPNVSETNVDMLEDSRAHRNNKINEDVNKKRKCNKRKQGDTLDKTENVIGVSLLEDEQLTQAIEMSLSCDSFVSDTTDRNRESPFKSPYKAGAWISPRKRVKSDSNPQNFDAKTDKSHCDDMDPDLRMAIERSKIEHSPMKKVKLGNKYVDEEDVVNMVLEKSKKEVCVPRHMEHDGKDHDDHNPDNAEVIEINSQNSQEALETEINSQDNFEPGINSPNSQTEIGTEINSLEAVETEINSQNVLDSLESIEASDGDVDIVMDSLEEESTVTLGDGSDIHEQSESYGMTDNTDRSDSDIKKSDHVKFPLSPVSDEVQCTDTEKEMVQKDDDVTLGDNIDCTVKVNEKGDCGEISHSDGVNKDTVENELENCSESQPDVIDDDYIPPSPPAVSTPDSVSFKQVYFSRTPNTAEINKSVLSFSSKNDADNSLPSGNDKVKGCKEDMKEKSKAYNLASNLNLIYDSDESSSDSGTDESDGETGKGGNDRTSVNKNSDDREIASESGLEVKESADSGDRNAIESNTDVSCNVTQKSHDHNVKVLSETEVKEQLIVESEETSHDCVTADVKLSKISDSHIAGDEVELNQNDESVEDELNEVEAFDDVTDIDYQPDSQYVTELVEACSADTDTSDDEEDCDSDLEVSCLEKSDPELLPVIRRPRRVRYRELQKASEKLLEQKKQEMLNCNSINYSVKIEVADETSDDNVSLDELYARQLQEDLDNDANTHSSGSLIDDAYIARQMQDMFDKESNKKSSPTNTDRYTPLNVKSERLSDSLNSSIGPANTTGSTGRSISPSMGTNSATFDYQTNNGQGNPDHIIRELQRREYEKLERWKQLLVEDGRLAKRMQEMHDAQTSESSDHKEADVATPRKDDSSQAVTPTFKQTVAKHKASREKALLQLQEYRRLQMDRFRGSQSQNSQSHPVTNVLDRHAASRSHTTTSVPGRNTGMINPQQHDVLIVDEPIHFFANQRHGTNTQRQIDVTNTQRHFDVTNIQILSNHGNMPPAAGNSFTQASAAGPSVAGPSVAGPSGQGRIIDDNRTNQPANPDTGMKNSNIKCGNCGEKGHNRTYVKCPRYHSAEESARREAKFEKQRQQKEEKKKQEVETIHMLTEHRRVLEDMTSQIQREMNTIQHRLQQRASELETQVNVRVKKIEGAKKKK